MASFVSLNTLHFNGNLCRISFFGYMPFSLLEMIAKSCYMFEELLGVIFKNFLQVALGTKGIFHKKCSRKSLIIDKN